MHLILHFLLFYDTIRINLSLVNGEVRMLQKQKTGLQILAAVLVLIFLAAAGVSGWYWYDSHVDRSGWVEMDGTYWYRDFHNQNVTGWQEINGKTYFFENDGIMQTGWLSRNGQRYYLDTDGTLVTGWFQLQDRRYHFNEKGEMETGLLKDGDGLYYLSDEGVMVTGLQQLEAGTYYFTEEGPAVTGAFTMEGRNYFFSPDGTMQTGWVQQEDGRHYYLSDGTMAYGFQEIDGSIYYLEPDSGLPHVGWYSEGEYSYYFNDDGAAATGPREIDGQQYYFSPKGIYVLLVNASNPIPDYYDPDLVTLVDWYRISKICLEPMKQMLKDCRDAGNNIKINSIYRSGKNQAAIMEERLDQYMNNGMPYEQAYAKVLEIVAPPGTSEHETGLSADLVGEDAKKWLSEHCWEYGFILRYPPEKAEITGIMFEPWHFRYVGKEVSMDMKDTGLCLEEYLGAGPAKK